MKRQALIINKWAKNVYVKVPVVNSKGKFTGKIIKELIKRVLSLTSLQFIQLNILKIF